jgi:serine/threonine protein kinase
MRDDNGALQRERDAAILVHKNQTCPTVMPVLDLVSLPGEPQRAALITPYYPLPLAPLANGNLHEEGCLNVALCGIGTVKAFHSKGLCHGDIKPGNMMLSAGNDNLVVTIDFGSAVKYGESLASVTPRFGMDCPQEGSLVYDLTCLASSLYMICTGNTLPHTSRELVAMLDAGFKHTIRPSLQIAKTCLESTDVDSIWDQAQTVVDAAHGIDRSLIVSFSKVWPAVHPT